MSKERAVKFVEEHLKTIFAYALSRVSRKEDAEDLTNDIIVAILQNADRLKNPDAFYGYVWGIAANTYRNFLKKRSRIICEEPDDNLTDHYDFTKELEEQETISVLRREVALLSREYRECAIAYYYEELSCTEIARKYHLSLEMVKYYLFKTRKILKEGICMEREFGEKSFRPAPFTFHTIFTGSFNQEYRDLFARKLPGQILLSAPITASLPMKTRKPIIVHPSPAIPGLMITIMLLQQTFLSCLQAIVIFVRISLPLAASSTGSWQTDVRRNFLFCPSRRNAL